MAAFVEEKPTQELRWKKWWYDLGWLGKSRTYGALQQKWIITRGGEGRGVEYTEEWRNVPIVQEEISK